MPSLCTTAVPCLGAVVTVNVEELISLNVSPALSLAKTFNDIGVPCVIVAKSLFATGLSVFNGSNTVISNDDIGQPFI